MTPHTLLKVFQGSLHRFGEFEGLPCMHHGKFVQFDSLILRMVFNTAESSLAAFRGGSDDGALPLC